MWLTASQGCDRVWIQLRMKVGAEPKSRTNHGDIDGLFISMVVHTL